MKWAKTATELSQIRLRLKQLLIKSKDGTEAGIDNEINAYYEKLPGKLNLCDLHDKGFGEWLVVKKLPERYDQARARYEAFVGGFLYFFEKHVSKTAPVNLIGFIIFNNEERLGEVEAVIEQPQQILLQTHVQQKEVLIPIHEQTLKKIDRKKKQVYVTLPEGLLEIYLE